MKIAEKEIDIIYRNHGLSIAYFRRQGHKKNILFLHGLGCAKVDFAGAAECDDLRDYTLVSFDFPGCGGSSYPENMGLTMDDLVEITHMTVDRLNIGQCILIGHSMGGLIGLLFAGKYRGLVDGFINVEGNLAGEDCFISRKPLNVDFPQFKETGFPGLIKKLLESSNKGIKKYGGILEKYSSPRAFYDYCPSLVHYSEEGESIEKFLKLNVRKLFIYGSENRTLSYIPGLKQGGCDVIEIPGSSHCPHYDNPAEFYRVIADFAAFHPA